MNLRIFALFAIRDEGCVFATNENFTTESAMPRGKRLFPSFLPINLIRFIKTIIGIVISGMLLNMVRILIQTVLFFKQMKELQLKVPRLALMNVNAVNSEYCNFSYGNKNCYLVFGGDLNQDTMYGTLCMKNVNVLDADYSNFNELSSMPGDTLNCYSCHYAFDSINCSNSSYISDCASCSECILCTNLVNQSYMILNTRYSKDDYLKKKNELLRGSYSRHCANLHDFQKLLQKRVVKYSHTVNSEQCSGDYIKNSKNCTLCFDVAESQDLSGVIFSNIAKDCFRCSLLGDSSELCYNAISTFNSYYDISSFFVIDSSNIEYCDFILNCQHLFGCVGLKRQKYSILNKCYSEADYVALRARIIDHMKHTGEWGLFLSQDLSPFGYNETTAYDYFPLNRDEEKLYCEKCYLETVY